MSVFNGFRTEPPCSTSDDPYGPEPYDINWPFPLHSSTLENHVVQLTPFIPRLFAEAFWAQAEPAAGSLMRWIPRTITTLEDYLASLEDARGSPEWIMFAVADKTKNPELGLHGALAGQIALLHTSIPNRSTEIGSVIILPQYQKTHVTSNATGLLLKYCLNSPEDGASPGLGLRRVDWRAHSWNKPSIATAKRMGFAEEGTLRWYILLPEGKEGQDPGPEDDQKHKGRHTVFHSMCWDDWMGDARKTVEKQMQRRS